MDKSDSKHLRLQLPHLILKIFQTGLVEGDEEFILILGKYNGRGLETVQLSNGWRGF